MLSLCAYVACGGQREDNGETSAPLAPCEGASTARRADWVINRSTAWSLDPAHPESNSDHGLRVSGRCNTALQYRAPSCDAGSVRQNVHGFSFFVAERLGFTTVICDEIDGVDSSKRLVEFPIRSAYEQGEFVGYMVDGFREYSERMCKCTSRACGDAVRIAYDDLVELAPLIPQDRPSRQDSESMAEYGKRYSACASRFGLPRGASVSTSPAVPPEPPQLQFIGVFLSSGTKIQKCYEASLSGHKSELSATDPWAGGRVDLTVLATFSASGQLKALSFTPALGGSFEACLKKVGTQWRLKTVTPGTYRGQLRLMPP